MQFTDAEIQRLIQDADASQRDELTRCQQGDRDALNQFARQHQDALFAHVYRLVGDRRKAETITRDIFAEAYQSFSQFRGDVPVKVWLFRLVEQHLSTVLSAAPRGAPEPETVTPADAAHLMLVAYLDGELSDQDAEQVEQRLADDAAYRQMYADLRATQRLMRTAKQPSAPADLIPRINARVAHKQLRVSLLAQLRHLGQMISDAAVILKKKWDDATAFPVLKPVAVLATLLVICSIAGNLYQYRRLQVQETHIQRLEKYRALVQRSSAPGQPTLQPTFVILTGQLNPQQLGLDDTRKLARVLSEFAGEQEPFFIPGTIDQIVAQLQTQIPQTFWNERKEHTLSREQFTIRQISVTMPLNANASFAQALKQLAHKPDDHIIAADTTTIPVDLYIIDRQ